MPVQSDRLRDAFLRGKIVTLCVPDVERDVLGGDWHSWFNDKDTTEFLEHGLYPISVAHEAEIVREAMASPNALLLTIASTEDGSLLGVIALRDITHPFRRAEISMVTNQRRVRGAALEAMALLTKHAFDRLNLIKIWAGQHEGLGQWANSLSLIGYKVEGLQRQQTIRNGAPADVLLIGITAEDFYALQEARGGDVVMGDAAALLSARPDLDRAGDLRGFLADLNGREDATKASR